MDPLNEFSISPYKVQSIRKALNLSEVDSNVASTASTLAEIKAQNATMISLLQQLVDK